MPTDFCVGATLELGFDVWQCASYLDNTAGAEWTTDNAAVATVERGVVLGIAPGTATITARAGEFEDTLEVRVRVEGCPPPPVDGGTDVLADSSTTDADAGVEETSDDASDTDADVEETSDDASDAD
jgi:hypothetical protein